jgi:transposase
MTLRDVVVYIKNSRGVTYSYKTVWYILRKKKKVKYGKPYIKNIKRPDDAEDNLKKTLVPIKKIYFFHDFYYIFLYYG